MSKLLDRFRYFKQKGETFADGHGQVMHSNRDWEDSYRQRWQFDKIVRSTHGVNCTGSCSWKIYVKNGLVTWEIQQTDYPRTRPDLPNHEPRGCPRGASYSWYLYSANRLKYPLIRKRLIELWREALKQHSDPVLAWASIMNDPQKCLSYKQVRGRGGFIRSNWQELNQLIAAANVWTIKTYGPDRVAGFSPIPAMSMVSYAAGTRYLSLLGGTCLSFYDWYCDLPPASPIGILLVPCCRGGSAFTQGTEGTFSESTGASQDSARWGVGKPLYQDLLFRTKAALQKNPKNVLLAICWMQGEFDMTNASYAQQPAAFLAMVQQFRADLAGLAAQCHGGSPASVPWICGDTTYAWKQEHGTQYEVVYGAYKGKESQQIYFVPFMTDGSGVNTPTNNPSEDPDIVGSGYYGSASRTNKNWVSSNRPTHFSSWARRGIIPDRMATAILNAAGRTSAFISGKAPEIKPSPGGDTPSGPSADTSVRTISLLPTAGEAAAQGWSIKNGGIQLSDGVFKITKQSNKAWSLTRPVDDAVSLLTRGGRLSCKFRLSGALTNNQFGLGIYLYTDVALPDVVAMTGTGNPFLMSFFTQTTDGKLNLMHHKKAGNTKLGEFGNYSNDWQTLELVFTAGSATVTPKLNGVAGPAFQVIKDSLTVGLNALTLTDITKNATYGVEIESLVLEINAPASS
ncbi:DUF6645 domain-containing protein [Escherichia coli]